MLIAGGVGAGVGVGTAIASTALITHSIVTFVPITTTVAGTAAAVVPGALALSVWPAAAIGATAFVWVGVGIKLGLALGSGESFEDSVRSVLGEPGPIHGPNLGVLFVGGNGPDNDELDPPVQDGIRGNAGSRGAAQGAAIYGDVTVSRTLVAENEARRRTLSRTETVITECLDPIDLTTVIDCSTAGIGIQRETAVFELNQEITELDRNEVQGGARNSDGTNLIGVANVGFPDDLTGSSANPLDAKLHPNLAFNGGVTPTIALLPGSPARGSIPLSSPDTSQNHFTWQSVADIGAWGGEPNAAPVGVADEFTILEGGKLVVDDLDALAGNDNDPNDDDLQVVSLNNETPSVGRDCPGVG